MAVHVHSHKRVDMRSRRLGVAVAINMLLTVVQVIGGILSGSLTLMV